MKVPNRDLLPMEVARRLGPFYVYLLSDPRTDEIFYVGKGSQRRMIAHLAKGVGAELATVRGESRKRARIHDIRTAGHEPTLEVARHGLTEREALLLESALIDSLRPQLTNAVAGHDSTEGRTSLDELVARYSAPIIRRDVPPALMIRLTPPLKLKRERLEPGYWRAAGGWEPGMNAQALLDATRGWWVVKPQTVARLGIRHAVPVAEGITRAVYEIDEWIGPRSKDGRYAFIGHAVGRGAVRDAYFGRWGRRVPSKQGAQWTIRYWPPAKD